MTIQVKESIIAMTVFTSSISLDNDDDDSDDDNSDNDDRDDDDDDNGHDDADSDNHLSAIPMEDTSCRTTIVMHALINYNRSKHPIYIIPTYLSTQYYLPTYLSTYLPTYLPTYLSPYLPWYVSNLHCSISTD